MKINLISIHVVKKENYNKIEYILLLNFNIVL
jgi:hypothetical protein